MDDTDGALAPATSRRIAALAFPALGVLAAEPLYLLFDLAVVGRLGALSLAGLAIGALIMGVMNNGMSIMGIGIDYQQVIKGLVLLAAVIFDVYNKAKRA